MKTAYAASRCQQTTICACLPLEEWLISLSDKQYVRFAYGVGRSCMNIGLRFIRI